MAYMVMLVLREAGHLEDVLDAWKTIRVDHVTFVESVCSLPGDAEPPHIPMRFLFEGVGGAQEQCSFTLFAVLSDDEALSECIAQVEGVVGDLDASDGALLAAWPLSVVRGYPWRAKGGRTGG
jgi:hypothetical protein